MAEYNGAVDFISKTFRLDEGLALSFSFLLKAGFEGEIVQRSKMYTLDSLLLWHEFFFVDFLDTKDWGDIIEDWFLMFSGEIPNKRAPRFKTCLDDNEWFAGPSSFKN